MIDSPLLLATEAEQSVLGALMLNPDAFDRIEPELKSEQFAREDHQRIYAAIVRLRSAGKPHDAMAVADELDAAGHLQACGGLSAVVEIEAAVPSAANVRRHAEIVAERAMLRALRATGDEIAQKAIEPGMSPAEKVDFAQSKVLGLTESVRQKFEPVFMRDALQRQLARMAERMDGTKAPGLSTGFPDLDKRSSGGLHPGQLIILAARPAIGKTALAMQVALHFALNDIPSLVCSQEMPESDLMNRLVALHARVELNRVIDTRTMHDDDWDRLVAASGALRDAPLAIDEQPSLNILAVRNKVRRVRREYGRVGLLVVDYLQLMVGDGSEQNRNGEIEKISRGLKQLAKEEGMPVLALSQLNREVEKRPNKRPMASDLRDSGAIEQDADVIWTLYRDEVYHQEPESSPFFGYAELGIQKNRQGAAGGFVGLAYRGALTRFESVIEWPRVEEKSERSGRRRGFGND